MSYVLRNSEHRVHPCIHFVCSILKCHDNTSAAGVAACVRLAGTPHVCAVCGVVARHLRVAQIRVKIGVVPQQLQRRLTAGVRRGPAHCANRVEHCGALHSVDAHAQDARWLASNNSRALGHAVLEEVDLGSADLHTSTPAPLTRSDVRAQTCAHAFTDTTVHEVQIHRACVRTRKHADGQCEDCVCTPGTHETRASEQQQGQ